jgi:hypothetical protein
MGYFIDNENNRVECLIRNEGWFKNPSKFSYKLSEAGEKLEAQISTTREFGVGVFRYFRETVELDTSSQVLQRLSVNSAPEWATKTIFLQLLVDGPARLFRYRTRDLQLFFYSVNSTPVEQLVYKRYSVTSIAVAENLLFRSQMRGSVACDDDAKEKVTRLKYQVDDISSFFEEFNHCKGFVQPTGAKSDTHYKSKMRLTITPGYDIATISMVSDGGQYDSSPQDDPGYRLGAMLEFTLPFNRNKWALLVEPTFQHSLSGGETLHSSIELPLGVRHTFFLNEDISVFLNAMMVVDLVLAYKCKSPFDSFNQGKLNPDEIAGGAAAGVGVRWKFLSFEPRYYFNRRVTAENRWHLVDYSKVSMILGVTIR